MGASLAAAAAYCLPGSTTWKSDDEACAPGRVARTVSTRKRRAAEGLGAIPSPANRTAGGEGTVGEVGMSELIMPTAHRTLAPAAIAAERHHRGAPIVKLDAHGREIYEPDGAVLTRFVTSNNKVDILQGPIGA